MLCSFIIYFYLIKPISIIMKFDFDRVIDRTGTASVKFDGLKQYFGRTDLIPMWVADMDFRVPESVINSIRQRTEHAIFGYPLITPGFYNSIIQWIWEKHGWDIAAEWIVFTPGIVPALSMSVMVLTEPGDKVLVQSPVYPPFFSSIQDNDRILVNNQLNENNGRYTIDFNDLDARLSDGVRLMFFCNPHNPVGRVWTREEVEKVIGLCQKHNVVLISDEIHSDLIFPGYTHISAALAGKGPDNMVICMAPSKTFNLAGMASAFLIIPDQHLREKIKKILENLHIQYGNIFGLTALQAAYEGGAEWLDALMDYLLINRDTVIRFFNDEMPEIIPVVTEGTYLMWLDCRAMGLRDLRLKRFFIQSAGIAMNPGPAFGPGGEGFQRLNIGCPRSTLLDALNRIKIAWVNR